MVGSIKASMLLELEGGCALPRQAASKDTLPVAQSKGILLKGLDKRFGSVWAGGHVVGVGSLDEVDGATTGKVSPRTKFVLLFMCSSHAGDGSRAVMIARANSDLWE
jgi:hypothetical protein